MPIKNLITLKRKGKQGPIPLVELEYSTKRAASGMYSSKKPTPFSRRGREKAKLMRSHGDHIVPYATHIRCMMEQFSGVEIPISQIAQSVLTRFHPLMIGWLNANNVYLKTLSHLPNCGKWPGSLLRKYAKSYSALKQSTERIKRLLDDEQFERLIPEVTDYLIGHTKLYYALGLTSAQKEGTYNPSLSGVEGSRIADLNAQLRPYLESQNIKSLEQLLVTIDTTALLSDPNNREANLIWILKDFTDIEAMFRMAYEQCPKAALPMFYCFFILQLWVIFEGCGITRGTPQAYFKSFRPASKSYQGLEDLVFSLMECRSPDHVKAFQQALPKLGSSALYSKVMT